MRCQRVRINILRLPPRGVVLKRSGGTPETTVRLRFLKNLGLHTRILIHVRKIATADLWSCPAIGLQQRFSNWGPRTKGGPRRVPTGSPRGFRKVVIVCTVFNNLRPMCFQICTHKSVIQSQCIATQCSAKPRQHFHAMIALKCCRGLARQAFC